MTDAAEWQKNNEAYLAVALKWVRARLMSVAPAPPPVIVPDKPPQIVSSPARDTFGWWFFHRHKRVLEMTAPGAQKVLPAYGGNAISTQAAEDDAALDAASKVEPPPALVILSERLGLSRFEQQVLLLCAAVELDTRIATLCARAQDDMNKPYPTFALALSALDEPTWDALSPPRPLRYLRLLEINQPAAQPLTASALRVDERVLNFIKGLNTLDDRLAPLLAVIDVPGLNLPPSQQKVVDEILREVQLAASNAGAAHLPLLELTGSDNSSKQLIAMHVAGTLGLQLYRLPAELLPANASELETLARLWQRETLLKPVALYLDASELSSETPSAASLQRFIAQRAGLVFLDTRETWNVVGEEIAAFDVESPTTAEQKEAWTTALEAAFNDSAPPDETEGDVTKTFEIDGDEMKELPALLANQFNLNLPAIHSISQTALEHRAQGSSVRDAVWEMCLAHARPRLDTLAQRLEPKATRSDIVLPEEATKLLEQVVEQVRRRSTVYDDWGFRARMNRGLGISALFAGESGTGKTMAAEVIANELRLNLYRIDLSAVVSKYIGETEKNLRRLFDAAEGGGAILFFDEADALFGKRSEVKDSHDRYANIEINYLLQRMEAYRGLAILATNMKGALDAAFMRRLRFIVNFPFPGAVERKEIWRKVFPPGTPTDELDFERLARFNLSGGSIHNIALNAAFMATAQEPPRVTMRLIFDAARAEFRKLDRPINEADFALR